MVLLYGQSLLLSGVAVGLGQCPGVQVVQAATWPEASLLLAERIPDVVITDLIDSSESHILPLLLKNPHLLLIGLDAECNQGVLLSGKEIHSFTMSQIEEIATGWTEPRKENGGCREHEAFCPATYDSEDRYPRRRP